MKIDRHSPRNRFTAVKQSLAMIRDRPRRQRLALIIGVGVGMLATPFCHCHGETPITSDSGTAAETSAVAKVNPRISQPSSEPEAMHLLSQVLHMIVYGPAFDAKVRETVWTNSREVVGVGTYEQTGNGKGQFNLQVTMHDGGGKHHLQQISDGRLAWTRSDIAGKVSLRRVDVGRLDEWIRGAEKSTTISPRLLVGAWAEMLSTIARDYHVQVDGAKLKQDPVWVITGTLKQSRRKEIAAESGREEWPLLHPTRIRVAIRSTPDPDTDFGRLIPTRIEFWSDPVHASDPSSAETSLDARRLITLVELYSIRPISPPPPERFRFENQDAEVNFVNETDRYIQLYGVRLTERQRRQLRR